jgi:uncharacterized repeat protein (TIGR03847 family)
MPENPVTPTLFWVAEVDNPIIYEHEFVDRFVAGTVGPPGERAFFLQVSSPIGTNTVAVEKTQVAALSEKLLEMITELRRSKLASLDELGLAAVTDNANLDFPLDEEFRAGLIGISWESSQQRIAVEIQSISDDEEIEFNDPDELMKIQDQDPLDILKFNIRINQARGFCERAKALVAGGRAPCPFCGLPIDGDGHLCPRANGYRR